MLLVSDRLLLSYARHDGRMDIMADALMLCGLAGYLCFVPFACYGRGPSRGCLRRRQFLHPSGGGIFRHLRNGIPRAFTSIAAGSGFQHLVILFRCRFFYRRLLGVATSPSDLPAFNTQIAGNAKGRWEGITRLGW